MRLGTVSYISFESLIEIHRSGCIASIQWLLLNGKLLNEMGNRTLFKVLDYYKGGLSCFLRTKKSFMQGIWSLLCRHESHMHEPVIQQQPAWAVTTPDLCFPSRKKDSCASPAFQISYSLLWPALTWKQRILVSTVPS